MQPALAATLGKLPLIGALFSGPPLGIGLLSAGFILAIMIIPYIASVMRDVFEVTPVMLKESAYGLGCTTWEVMYRVVLPYTKTGVVGGVMLGLGRALGETMAVTFVIGNSNFLLRVAVHARQQHYLRAGQRICRSGPGTAHLGADGTRPGAFRDHPHRARLLEAAACKAVQPRRRALIMDLKTRRKLTNKIALTLSIGTMAFGLFWLAWILWTVLELGIGGLSLSLFTEMTPPPGLRTAAC